MRLEEFFKSEQISASQLFISKVYKSSFETVLKRFINWAHLKILALTCASLIVSFLLQFTGINYACEGRRANINCDIWWAYSSKREILEWVEALADFYSHHNNAAPKWAEYYPLWSSSIYPFWTWDLSKSKMHLEAPEFGLNAIAINGTSLRIKCFKPFKSFTPEKIALFAKNCTNLNEVLKSFEDLAQKISASWEFQMKIMIVYLYKFHLKSIQTCILVKYGPPKYVEHICVFIMLKGKNY